MYRALQWLEVKHIKWICNVYFETFNSPAYNHRYNCSAEGKVERR